LASAQARVIESAVPPQVPYKPKRARIVAISVLLALLFGVGAALLLASLDATIKNSSDVAEKLKRPLLGIVPLLKGNALSVVSTPGNTDEAREVDLRFAEAMRTIRTAVSLDRVDKPHKIILVTSSIGNEGKSIVALNLAIAFARAEKTLLLDGDMRRPSVRKMLGLRRDVPGLSELLSERARLIECIIKTGFENLDAISTGFIPPDPLELLSSPRMTKALKVLANDYARVIIDCPPILPVSDAALLSKYADSVLFVVKADATPAPQIRNGLALLERVDAPITGIVLTQLDTRKAEKYGDYGYAGYYAPYASKS
ncbi:MAG: polysaccharide biosynthesis tyrosine autokinase, partial [Betaproteobacteria bacterium]